MSFGTTHLVPLIYSPWTRLELQGSRHPFIMGRDIDVHIFVYKVYVHETTASY